MAWKNLASWLKGGIIGGVIVLIMGLIIRLFFDINIPILDGIIFLFIIIQIFLVGFPVGYVLLKPLGIPESNFIISHGEGLFPILNLGGILLGVILWFIIGALIGWFIGLIKSKNSNKKR